MPQIRTHILPPPICFGFTSSIARARHSRRHLEALFSMQTNRVGNEFRGLRALSYADDCSCSVPSALALDLRHCTSPTLPHVVAGGSQTHASKLGGGIPPHQRCWKTARNGGIKVFGQNSAKEQVSKIVTIPVSPTPTHMRFIINPDEGRNLKGRFRTGRARDGYSIAKNQE